MAEEKISVSATDSTSTDQPSMFDLQNVFKPSSDKKTATPPGKVAEALQGKLQSVADKQVATETPSPGSVRDEMDVTKKAIADQEFLHEFAKQVADLYSNLRTDTIRYESSSMPLAQMMDALLKGTNEKVDQYGTSSGELSPLLVSCVKSARSLKEGLNGFQEALQSIQKEHSMPKSKVKGKAASNNGRSMVNTAVFSDGKGSLFNQASKLFGVLGFVNGHLKIASQDLHIAFDAEDMTALFQEVLDQAKALHSHFEEKEAATTKAEQALADALVELRTQLLTHLTDLQAASGDRQRLLDHKKLTKSFADTLNIRWGTKKEGGKEESPVPASLGKQQKELNKLKEDWEVVQKAVVALQTQIEEENNKAKLLNGHISDLSETQEQVNQFMKALAKARAAFKLKNVNLQSPAKKSGKGGKQSFNSLDDLVGHYVNLLGFLQQMEMHLSAVLLQAEKELAEDPLLAALAPLKEQMDGLAEPAGNLLDQLMAAQFTLDTVRGTLSDIQDNLIELEERMNSSDALLTSFSKLKLNEELSRAKKEQDMQVNGLEQALAKKEKEESLAEEVYEKAQATFDFEMMLRDE